MEEKCKISKKEKVLTLCGTQGCCPTITLNQEQRTSVIKDDFGGSVRLSYQELKDLTEKLKKEEI